MIVLDASLVVELLVGSRIGDAIREELSSRGDSFVAPQLLDLEVVSAFRNLAISERWNADRCRRLIEDLELLPALRVPYKDLLARVWELRYNFTCYDAVYIALAEALDAVLYTCDGKLQRGHHAQVRVFHL